MLTIIMDIHAKYRQQFYQQQNIQLRKQVREIDLLLAQSHKKQEENGINSCVFLVLGSAKSGKTSLLQTLQFALNGSHGWGRMRRGAVTSYEIKRGARWQVEGVKEVKETERKYTILGLQLNSEERPCIRYKRALEYVDSGLQGCLQKGCEFMNKSLARVCLICIDACADLPYEELTYLRFLKVDLNERHIKLIFLLTKADKKSLGESQKCLWLENRIWQIMKDLDIKDRDDIIIMQNYSFPDEKIESYGKIALSSLQSNKIENNEQINYYSLQLLLRVIQETEKVGKWYNKSTKSWICGWA